MKILNIAIIAHVDHGKTKLTDAILRQTGAKTFESGMDSNAIEQERGITIYSKNASFRYKETKINIVDTPGHADFGSEVERVLRAIDTVVLVVDAAEGPMPQTRFVLKKSLEHGHSSIVVINKIDKPSARPKEVLDEIYELYLSLGASAEQIDFPVIYTNAKDGIATRDLDITSTDLTPLLDTIVTSPHKELKTTGPMSMQVFNLGYDNFLGRLGIARITSGHLKKSTSLYLLGSNPSKTLSLSALFTFEGIERTEAKEALTGDIVMIAGIPDIEIGDTLASDSTLTPLPRIHVDEPTIALDFLVNKSPFAGREGTEVTSRKLRDRLERELEINIGLEVEFSQNDRFHVKGRGELHIAILLENMRREGFEVEVSKPTIITKVEDGITKEPFMELTVDVPDAFAGTIIKKLGTRRGIMTMLTAKNGISRMLFEIPTRGFLGYRSEFIIDTKGEGILASQIIGFREFVGDIPHQNTGALISMAEGTAIAYSLETLQDRGQLYISPGMEIYRGMIVGKSSKGSDLFVNPVKGKNLTNVRKAFSEETIPLTKPIEITIERALQIVADDEYIEITPKSIRLRKQIFKS